MDILNVSDYPFTIMWGPGYIGLVVATFLYGVEICQFVFYLRAFWCDNIIMKLQVYIVAVLDTAQFFFEVASFHWVLINCRKNTSLACSYYVPRVVIYSILLTYCVTSMVQAFYAHRVWIISGRNMMVTLAVLASTTIQLVFGLAVVVELVRTPTNAVLFSPKYSPVSSVASAICDAIVTFSVIYYLRPASIRKENSIKKLLVVFVEMGLFTFINSVVLVILYYMQDHTLGQFLTSAPGAILSKSYVNSMLSVLNARKPIRDAQQDALDCSIELPTIPTLR